VPIEPDTRLRDCPEDQVALWIPRPLNARLDALVRLAIDGGENTNRKEVLAALLLDAPSSVAELNRVLLRLRTASARDAVVPGESEEAFLAERERRPGPRPRKQT
jgi:hypothetical protein